MERPLLVYLLVCAGAGFVAYVLPQLLWAPHLTWDW
jgi:hypothetical protein